MKNSEKLNAFISDEQLNECSENISSLQTMLIENAAQTAFNNVIFEAAMDDEVLTEKKDEESKGEKNTGSKIKNAAYKALDTLKRFFGNIMNKIKAAINKFIASASSNYAERWIKKFKKEDNSDTWSNATVKPKKFIYMSNPKNVFRIDLGYGTYLQDADDEEKVAKSIISTIKLDAGNYADAQAALKDCKSIAEIGKVITTLTSYVKDNEETYSLDKMLSYMPDEKRSIADLKSEFQAQVKKGNDVIKMMYKELNGSSDEEVAKIKDQIAIVNKLISLVYSFFIGYMKYIIAANAQTINAIKSAKKGGLDDEPTQESFMGLALL